MKRSRKNALELKRETLRQLAPAQLGEVVGGARKPPVYFDLEAYLRYCNGTVYP